MSRDDFEYYTNYVVRENDRVCYNCDNFERNNYGCAGHCLLCDKTKRNNTPACNKFIKMEEY